MYLERWLENLLYTLYWYTHSYKRDDIRFLLFERLLLYFVYESFFALYLYYNMMVMPIFANQKVFFFIPNIFNNNTYYILCVLVLCIYWELDKGDSGSLKEKQKEIDYDIAF